MGRQWLSRMGRQWLSLRGRTMLTPRRHGQGVFGRDATDGLRLGLFLSWQPPLLILKMSLNAKTLSKFSMTPALPDRPPASFPLASGDRGTSPCPAGLSGLPKSRVPFHRLGWVWLKHTAPKTWVCQPLLTRQGAGGGTASSGFPPGWSRQGFVRCDARPGCVPRSRARWPKPRRHAGKTTHWSPNKSSPAMLK